MELKDTGVRDEDGMEPLPSFSSPVKLASPPHRLAHESTYTADDTMDIGQSKEYPLKFTVMLRWSVPLKIDLDIGTIAEPEEVVRSVKYARTSLPPRSASPRKTGVRGIPRRSIPRPVGAMSSPSANINKGTPSRPVSHPPVNRQLDFSLENSRHHSPRNLPSSGLKASKQASITGKGKKRTFDVSVRGDYNESLDDMNGANGIDSVDEDGQLPNGGDESLGNLRQDHVEISIEEEDPPLVNEESEMFGSEAPSKAEPTNGGRRQPRPQAVVQKDDSQVSLSGPDPPRRGRPGRPPKQPRTDVFRDDNVGTSMPPPKGKRKPAEKDPNDRTRAPLKTTTKPSVSRSGSAGSRAGNVVKRSETPAADSVLTTRSGRHSYKPLASWRGEHLVMGQRDDLDSLPEITAVVRTDEILDAPKKKYGYRKARPRARSQLPDVQEEDEELAPWEADTGIMHGQVMPWDRDTERYDEDNTEEAGTLLL